MRKGDYVKRVITFRFEMSEDPEHSNLVQELVNLEHT